MRVLFVTNEPLGVRRSGPAIRCVELARVLAVQHEVTIATLQSAELTLNGIVLLSDALNRKRELHAAAKASDVVITQGLVLARHPALEKLARHLVIDLYDPYLFEYLQHAHPRHPSWGYLRQWYRLNQQMLAGDFFLCANERQWDYWLGRLCALGRLNPEEHTRDASFRSLLNVVPFGLPAEGPKKTAPALRGVVPGIGEDDLVLLWAGGLWQWLDPLTPIRAIQKVAAERSNVKMVFLGGRDPNPRNRAMGMGEEARNLAKELKLLDRAVFFHDEWVPYDQRHNFLLEADVGISAHPATVEARFAFRTRVLDYIWAGLPMILSAGDDFGDWVERERVGIAVQPQDLQGWTRAIRLMAENASQRQQMKQRLSELASNFLWQKAAEPLLRYCEKPYKTSRVSPLRKKLAPLLSSGFEIARGLRG
jgi:glycosyltransferase involved in cell wall biosynthesis